ncbi:MAG: hypothetical protein HQK55_02970 [Deltaproteobacteria bacterium]|nr:hypothetical protein [Deltaproteobacteria bacterium]
MADKIDSQHSESKRYLELGQIFDLLTSQLSVIRHEIYLKLREGRRRSPDKSRMEIADLVANRLIRLSALRVGAVGGLTSIPADLPGLGTIATSVIGTTADLIYLARTQVYLCYAMSAVYETKMDDAELKIAILRLMGLSGSGELVKGIVAKAAKAALNSTTAKLVEKGLAEATERVSSRLSPRLLGGALKALPVINLIPLINVPISASINVTAVMMVGRLARDYFSAQAKEAFESCEA